MPLTPGESDRLLLFTQAELARARRSRGLLLNVPESVALIADAVCEWARDGLSLDETRVRARGVLSANEVLPAVLDVVHEVRVEARFDDGMRLVVVTDPFGAESGDSVSDAEPGPPASEALQVTNCAQTPIGISSHIHLAEVNPRLRLDRAAAFGMRPALSTGDVVWIDGGATVFLPITRIGGQRVVVGNTGVVNGSLDDPAVRDRALEALRSCGYLDIVNGQPFNMVENAEHAVGNIVRQRNLP